MTKKWGGKKHAKEFFQKHTNSARKICWGKNRWKKVRKHVFYIHTNIVFKKWWGKTRETIFPETQQIVRANNVRKKLSENSAKKLFL